MCFDIFSFYFTKENTVDRVEKRGKCETPFGDIIIVAVGHFPPANAKSPFEPSYL